MYSANVLLLMYTSFTCVFSSSAKSLPENNSSVLISEYAKVAHWGSARSSQGQKPWTQRSDASIIYGQNLKNHRSYDTSEVPAVGEVQERFNPKPYFYYGSFSDQKVPVKNAPDRDPIKISPPNSFDSPVYLPTPSTSVKVLSVPVLPTDEPKPHVDSYESPYSSYNPPPKMMEANDGYQPSKSKPSKDSMTYGSFNSPPDQMDSYLPGNDASANNGDDHVDFPSDTADQNDMENHIAPEEDDHHMDHINHSPPSEETPDGPPDHSSFDGHSHDHKSVIMDHPPPGYEDKEPQMAPPPIPEHFPHYLYDEGHSDHQVYHEVEKPIEQKRVSKPQYSYYYIGRKLWYVPLYFSVYFIIYVTFLILKAIARHKIHFKHDFIEHHSRESRQLTNNDDLNKLHQNVSEALEEGKEKFSFVPM